FYTGDNLLLLSADYRNPGSSASLKAIKECKDPKVAQLASLVQRLCLVDIAKVPSLESVVEALEKGTLDQLISTLPAPSAASGSCSRYDRAQTGHAVKHAQGSSQGSRPHASSSTLRWRCANVGLGRHRRSRYHRALARVYLLVEEIGYPNSEFRDVQPRVTLQ